MHQLPIVVTAKSAESRLRARREVVAQGVLRHFGERLPKATLLCYLDDQDWDDLRAKANCPAMRGFFLPVRRGETWHGSTPPADLVHTLFNEGVPAFQYLIYLHGSTCTNDVGLAMTLAHELQHLLQLGMTPLEYKANRLAFCLLKGLDRPSCQKIGITHDFELPYEHEARLVSRTTAEALFGQDLVGRFIQEKIANPVNEDDRNDWTFARELDTSTKYNLARETRALFSRLREYDQALYSLLQPSPDFQGSDLDRLLRGD